MHWWTFVILWSLPFVVRLLHLSLDNEGSFNTDVSYMHRFKQHVKLWIEKRERKSQVSPRMSLFRTLRVKRGYWNTQKHEHFKLLDKIKGLSAYHWSFSQCFQPFFFSISNTFRALCFERSKNHLVPKHLKYLLITVTVTLYNFGKIERLERILHCTLYLGWPYLILNPRIWTLP